jgi:hypothetical protein
MATSTGVTCTGVALFRPMVYASSLGSPIAQPMIGSTFDTAKVVAIPGSNHKAGWILLEILASAALRSFL